MTQCKSGYTCQLFFIAILLIVPIQVESGVPGLFFDRISLSSLGANNSYYNISTMSGLTAIPTSVKNFTYNWRETVLQTVSSGLCMHNYFISTPNALSFMVQLQNITTWKTDIHLQTLSASPWVLYLTFSVILLTVDSIGLQFIPYSSSFIILNNPSSSSYTQVFNVSSSKFTFMPNHPEIQIFCGLQWIRQNSRPHQYYSYLCNPSYTSKFIQLKFTVHCPSDSSLNSFKMSILFINGGVFRPNLAVYKTNLQNRGPIIFGSSARDYNCIFSFIGTDRYKTQAGYLLFTFIQAQDITGFNSSHQRSYFQTFCITSCPSDKFVDYSTNITQCTSCQSQIANCLSCSSKNVCTQCMPNAALINQGCIACSLLMHNCTSCSNTSQCLTCFLGFPAGGACTTVIGCTQAAPILSGTTYYSLCLACNQTAFYYNFTDQKCYCKVGWIVGDYCTTIAGCIATRMIGSDIVCTACRVVDRFELKNQSCVCALGFELKNKVCVEICGDGRTFTSQCDDGNLIDGDGCSSQCKVQILHKCTKSQSSPSDCIYYGLKLNITLSKIQKVQGQNQAIFSFSFDPQLGVLSKMNLIDYFIFSCNHASYSVEKWVYNNGQADVYVNYTTSLQGKSGMVNFTFQNSNVYHTPIQVNFTISAKNGKLLFINLENQREVSYAFMVLPAIGLFMVVFCSWLHKMIGVQFLFTCQIIYYAHFGLTNYESSASIFQFLGLSGFNYRSASFQLVNFKVSPQFQVLQFSAVIADITLLAMIALVTIPLVVNLILHLSEKPAFSNLVKKNLLMTKIASPLLLSFTFPSFFIYSSFLLREQTIEDTLLPRWFRAVLFFYLFSLNYLNFHLSSLRLYFKQSMKSEVNCFVEESQDCYLTVFQLLLFTSFGLCYLWLKLNFSYCLIVLIGVFLTMFLWQLVFKAYNNFIDNLGVNLNMALVVGYLFLVFLLNKNIIQQNQINKVILKYFTLIGLSICGLVSMIRLIQAIRRKINTQPKEKIENLVEVEKQKQLQIFMKEQQRRKAQVYQRSVKNKNYLIVAPVCQRVVPVNICRDNSNQEKTNKQYQQYLDMVSSYRQKYRKKKLKAKLMQEH